MFLQSFKITGAAVAQIFALGAIGFILVRKKAVDEAGLNMLSRLVINIVFPCFIFSQLARNFSFQLYPRWWIFPLASFAVTAAGLIAGFIFCGLIRGSQHKHQFVSLIAFQNSGWLPLALAASLLVGEELKFFLVCLFLFLLGFDLLVWSLGVFLLSRHLDAKFELRGFFNPPVVANLLGLAAAGLGINRLIPEAALKPLEMLGSCTLPLAMLVVGGNLAAIRLGKVDRKAVCLLALAKLIILPLAGLFLLGKMRLGGPAGLLILMQLAMPPATSLSLITRHYQREDLLISQGLFYGHIFSIVTIPLFLSLYYALGMIQ
jgi:predicted permease